MSLYYGDHTLFIKVCEKAVFIFSVTVADYVIVNVDAHNGGAVLSHFKSEAGFRVTFNIL